MMKLVSFWSLVIKCSILIKVSLGMGLHHCETSIQRRNSGGTQIITHLLMHFKSFIDSLFIVNIFGNYNFQTFIAFPPTFKKRPLESTTLGSLGGSLTILCHPEAAPRPIITWLYGGQAIPPVMDGGHARLQPLTSGHLLIVNLSYSDQGLYTCKAENALGSAQSSTKVTVLGKLVKSIH